MTEISENKPTERGAILRQTNNIYKIKKSIIMTNATYYAEKELSNLWEENGAFFAFSQSQFDKAAE